MKLTAVMRECVLESSECLCLCRASWVECVCVVFVLLDERWKEINKYIKVTEIFTRFYG